jgi:hypothetical protein
MNRLFKSNDDSSDVSLLHVQSVYTGSCIWQFYLGRSASISLHTLSLLVTLSPQRHRQQSTSASPQGTMDQDKLLWLWRTQEEESHLYELWLNSVIAPYPPLVCDVTRLALGVSEHDFRDICNKSVPLYIIPGRIPGNRPRLLQIVLHNYIYRRWFRPYRSELQFQRFICKVICPPDLPYDAATPTPPIIESIISLNQAICAGVEARRPSYEAKLKEYTSPRGCRVHVLQPLYQALIMVISTQNYALQDSKTVGTLPVFLVRTGAEEGLSSPITFKPIADKIRIEGCQGDNGLIVRTTLETAVDFVMDLEAREAAAFGLQPDPFTTWDPDLYNLDRWREVAGDRPLIGPSSRFVDVQKHPEWAGVTGQFDSQMTREEEREFCLSSELETGTIP